MTKDMCDAKCPVTSRVEALHTRVHSLEDSMRTLSDAVADISTTLAGMQKEFEYVNKNLAALTSLHERQIQIQSEQTHITDTVSQRFNELRDAVARAHSRLDKLEGLVERVVKLEEGRRDVDSMRRNIEWGVRVVVGAVILALLAAIGVVV